MGEISILPPEIFNRIAAGEVVERPSSVVKELIENSIDAGATQIKIRIERAGTKLIAVADNGRGMDGEDAQLALQPHGTSKIKCVEDIDRIVTLGFRGEALPSIASVSRFMLRTKRFDANIGFEVTADGGAILHTGPAGCAQGTEITIRDIFFNTPARRKFLRSLPTEESYIEEVVIAAALGNLNISFELISDSKQIYFSAAESALTPRLRDFFGKAFAENMIPVDVTIGAIRVTGAAAKPGLTRASRREQRSFVNGRPVESQAIFRGIRDGYSTLNERGRYSPCVLFIHMPLSDFDINVHPAKRDVRFRQDYNVSRAVTAAIGMALKNAPSPKSTLESAISLDAILQGAQINYTISEREQPVLISEYPQREPENTPPPEIIDRPNAENQWRDTKIPHFIATPEENEAVTPLNPAATDAPPVIEAAENETATRIANLSMSEFIGSLDNTYLLLFNTTNRALEIMDQHAAHERVIYEQLLAQADSGATIQQLLLPRTLELARPVAGWLAKNSELLGKLGFELAPLSSNTLLLNAVPALLPESEWELLLVEIYNSGRENTPGDSRPLLERTAAAACHAAVKAHDKLTKQEIEGLLRQLSKCERPDICPHGRPTIIEITLKELEKRFGRK